MTPVVTFKIISNMLRKKIFLIIVLLIFAGSLNSQWLYVNMPEQGIISGINYTGKTDIFVNQSYTYFPFPQISATTLRLFKSADNGALWNAKFVYAGTAYQPLGMTNVSFLNSIKGVFGFSSYTSLYLYKTANGGENWTSSIIPFSGSGPNSCEYLNDSTIIMLVYNSGLGGYFIIKSLNSGVNWSLISLPVSANLNTMNFKNQNTGFITTNYGSILKTTDAGLSWNVVNTGLAINIRDISFFNSLTGFAVGNNNSTSVILKTTDEGNSWIVNNSYPVEYFSSVSCTDTNIVFVSGTNRLIKSSDGGMNWNQILTFQGEGGSFIACYNKDTLAVSKLNMVYRTYNGGTPVTFNGQNVPGDFELLQNYPNPFNPETKIKFSVAENRNRNSGNSLINLTVYDVTGKEIAVLMNKRLPPGNYEVLFSDKQSSENFITGGIYFYRLTAGNKVIQTRKMVFMK
jgi:hypothetical protein